MNFVFAKIIKPSQSKKIKEEKHEEKLKEAVEELNSLIGLSNVKEIINEISAYIEIQKKRQKEGLTTSPMVLHMIFKGNPGTGKTTVARILGKIFRELGVLEKGHLIEVERADLVGEYIGHTAQKVRENIKKAMGGILFVDEAYSLARGGEKDFGKEAIDTIVKAMEDYKDKFIIILAGYTNEMEEFLRTNPGLRSRFPIHIEFNDYSIDELLRIAELMVEKRQYTLSVEAKKKIMKILLKNITNNNIKTGNARLVRNIIEKAIRKHAVRILSKKNTITKKDLMTIEAEDIIE